MPDWFKVNEADDTVTIYGVVYARAMFEQLGFGATGEKFRLVKRENDPRVLELVRIEPE